MPDFSKKWLVLWSQRHWSPCRGFGPPCSGSGATTNVNTDFDEPGLHLRSIDIETAVGSFFLDIDLLHMKEYETPTAGGSKCSGDPNRETRISELHTLALWKRMERKGRLGSRVTATSVEPCGPALPSYAGLCFLFWVTPSSRFISRATKHSDVRVW